MKFPNASRQATHAGAYLLVLSSLLLAGCPGGGGYSAPPPAPPLVQAFLFSFPTGSAPPANFPNALVSITDGYTGAEITNAGVTMNGVALTYNSAPTHLEYEGTIGVDPGAVVTLVVNVGGRTYTASGTQFTSYPTISEPVSGATWSASNANAATWSGGTPLTNAAFLLGVLDAADPAGGLPYLQVVSSATNSFTIPPNSLAAGNRDLIVGLTALASVSNADANSAFVFGGFNYVPITVVSGSIPSLASLSPNSATAGGSTFTLTINGSGFVPQSVLQWNGSARTTTYVSANQLTAQITAADIASAGTATVTVSNQATGGGTSSAVNFTILAPAPLALNSVSPTLVTAGGPAFIITAIGTGFNQTSVLQWNGTTRTTTFVSPTELLAQITTTDIAANGSASVTVSNPGTPVVVSTAAPVTIAVPSKDAVAFQMNAIHSGVTSFNAVTLPAASKWSVNLGGTPSYALIAGGNIFVTVNVAGNTQLIALSQATGATVWGPIVITGPANAAYDNGTVFVLSDVIGNPALLQAYDAATGTLKWSTSLTTQYWFTAPPTAAHGFVYVGGSGSGGTLYALNQSTGAIAWTTPVANGQSSAPAVSADSVYVTYPCQTYSFRPATGETVWQNNTGCSGGGGATPVVANGVLYSPNGMGGSYNGSTFNVATGTLLGSYVADNPPAIGSQTGYFLQSGTLRGISLATSTTLWSFTGDGTLVTSPIVVNSYVFVGSSSGNLYAVEATTGAQVWNVNMGAAIPNGSGWNAGMPISGLAAGNGLLVVPAGNTLTVYTLSATP